MELPQIGDHITAETPDQIIEGVVTAVSQETGRITMRPDDGLDDSIGFYADQGVDFRID